MAGGRPLIGVDEPSSPGTSPFRAQGDAAFVRYQKMPSGSSFPWQALSPNGTRYTFGAASHVGTCTIVSDEYAPLTSTSDPFSNLVEYFWEKGVEGECRIAAIAWGRNDHVDVGHFAVVRFVYAESPAMCGNLPVGAQTSYRSGTKIVTGASQLDAIAVVAFTPISGPINTLFGPIVNAQHTRVIRLEYDDSVADCGSGAASYRALESIEETAGGQGAPAVTLPPVSFKYGSASLLYVAEPTTPFVPWAAAGAGPQHNLGWGYRPKGTDAWPTVEATMVDLDGDGLIDRLVNEPHVENGKVRFCGARWYRNFGPAHAGSGQFRPAGYIELPTLKWATDSESQQSAPWLGGTGAGAGGESAALERCALNYQRTAYINSDNGARGPVQQQCIVHEVPGRLWRLLRRSRLFSAQEQPVDQYAVVLALARHRWGWKTRPGRIASAWRPQLVQPAMGAAGKCEAGMAALRTPNLWSAH